MRSTRARVAAERSVRPACLVALFASLAACAQQTPRTEVMLEIDADEAVSGKLETLRILIDVSDDAGKSWRHKLTTSFDSKQVGGWDKFPWPARLGLVPEGDAFKRRFAVRAQALDKNGDLYVWQNAVAGFEQGHTTLLRMTLVGGCSEMVCGDPDCVGASGCVTCRNGACVEVKLLPLPDLTSAARHDDAGADAGQDHDAQIAPQSDSGVDAGHDVGSMLEAGPSSADAGPGRDAGSSERDTGTGNLGNDAGKDAGSDGAQPDLFRVTASTPSGLLQDVAALLQVSFSAKLAAASVTSASFAVARNGQPVLGTLATSESGASFSPDAPWALAGSYTATLNSDIKDVDGRALEPISLDFKIREGVWSQQKRADIMGSSTPTVVMAKDGYAMLVWSSTSTVPNRYEDTLESRFTPPATWSAPLTIEPGLDLGPTAAAVNVKHHAGVTLTTISSDVDLSSFTAGPAWSSTVYLAQTAYNPFLLLTKDDGLYVVCDTPTKGSGSTVVGYNFTLGASSPASIDVGGTAAGNSNAQLALLGGAPLIVWQHTPSGSSVAQITVGTLSPASGTGISTAGVNAVAPQIVSDTAQASAVAVWQQTDPTWSNVWATRIAAGGDWSAPARVSDDTSSALKPVAAMDNQGRALAVWAQAGAVVSASFTPGSNWSQPVTISAAGVISADPPALAMEPGGNAIVAWTQDGPSMALNEVWVARYVSGSGWQTAARVRVSDMEAGTNNSVSLAIDDSGRAFAAWYQSNQIWVGRFE